MATYKQKFLLDDGTVVEADVDEEFRAKVNVPGILSSRVRNEVQKAEYLKRRINTEPYEYKPPTAYSSAPRAVASGNLQVPTMGNDEVQRRKRLAAFGETVGAGPFNKAQITYFKSLAKDSPYEFAEFFIPRVKAKIAPREDIDPRQLVRVEEGRVQFLDLQTDDNPAGTGRWTEFEGLDLGPLPEPFDSLEMGLDIAGSFGGAKFAKDRALKPFKEAAATATGAFAGATEAELIRLGLGKLHGITGPISDDPNASPTQEALATVGQASKRGGMAAGFSMAGSGIGRAYYNLTSGPNPYFFNPDTAKNYEAGLAQGDEVVARINAMEGGAGFNPTQAKRSGEQSLLSLESTLTSNASGKTELNIMGGILEGDQTNNRILNSILQRLTTPTKKVAGEEVGLAIKGVNLEAIAHMAPAQKKAEILRLLSQNAKDQKALGPIAEVAESGRQSLIRKLRGVPEQTEGVVTTQDATGLEKVLNGLQKSEADAWGKFETTASTVEQNLGKPLVLRIDGNNDPATNVLPQLTRFFQMADDLWFEPAKKRFTSVLQPLVDAATKNEGVVTLRALNTNLSQMKETLRIAKKETTQESPSVAVLETAINALQGVRDNYIRNTLRNPVLGDELLLAEEATKRVHDLTKRSVASKMLAKDSSGTYRIKDPDSVFQDIMVPGSDDGMRQWMDIVGDEPGLVQATKDWYGQHYHSSVIRNGLADPKAHQKWMNDYGSQAKLVFGEDFGAMQRLGGIGRAVAEGQKRLSELEGLLKISSHGKIQKMDTEQVVESLIGFRARPGGLSARATPLSLNETKHILRILKTKSPETFDLVQERTKEMLRMSIFGDALTARGSKQIKSATIEKFLDERQAGRLRLIFGDQYIDDMANVKRGLELMERSAEPIPIRMETPGISLFRVIFGPLSRTQRFITGLRRYSVMGQEKKLAEILTDPAKLREVMKLANVPAKSPFAMALLSSLGYLTMSDTEGGQMPAAVGTE